MTEPLVFNLDFFIKLNILIVKRIFIFPIVLFVFSGCKNEKVVETSTFKLSETISKEMEFASAYEQIVQFVNFVRAIPPGKGGQKNTLKERNILKEQIQCKNSLMKINPKVDSKNQRRVQCSFKLKEMLLSGIPYIKKDINIIIQSKKRTFNK